MIRKILILLTAIASLTIAAPNLHANGYTADGRPMDPGVWTDWKQFGTAEVWVSERMGDGETSAYGFYETRFINRSNQDYTAEIYFDGRLITAHDHLVKLTGGSFHSMYELNGPLHQFTYKLRPGWN